MTGRLAGHVVMSVVLVWLVAGYGWHCCRRTSRCGTCKSSCCCPPQSTRWVGPSLLPLPGMDWLGAVRSLMTTTYFPCCLSACLMVVAGPRSSCLMQGQTVGLIYNGTAYAAKAVPNDYQVLPPTRSRSVCLSWRLGGSQGGWEAVET